MADYTVIIKDDMDRERFFHINNIYISHGLNGELEMHLFGGPKTQERYEDFVKRYTPSKEKKDESTEGKETSPGTQP